MKDKTEQILKAALQVFTKKGFSDSTTQEIAHEAQVAEVTLFRKFKTKQNLFLSTIQSVLMDKFDKIVLQSSQHEDTEQFLSKLLNERLTAISKHQTIIKTLLSESLMGNLDPKIDIPMIMFRNLKSAMEHHFSMKQIPVDTDQLVRVFSGLLISYLVWSPTVPYHKLSKEEQSALTKQYVLLLKSF